MELDHLEIIVNEVVVHNIKEVGDFKFNDDIYVALLYNVYIPLAVAIRTSPIWRWGGASGGHIIINSPY